MAVARVEGAKKPWVSMKIPCSEKDHGLFAKATMITHGDGETASFWDSALLQGHAPKSLAPTIYKISKNKRRTVKAAISNDTWISDINVLAMSSSMQLAEYTQLWNRIRTVQLIQDTPDYITWNLTKHGEYTMTSAYEAQFEGLPPRTWNVSSDEFGHRLNANSSPS